jgi:CRP-like cAMP-binding protein
MKNSITLPDHILDPILKHVGEKINLSPTETDYFISLLQYKKFSGKSKILYPGEIGRNQYFVVKGCLRIFYLDPDGLEHNAKFAVENWWAFDIQSFFESTPAYYGISCLEDTEVFLLTYDNHAELMKHVPKFERFYRLMMQ